jgi:hypothetical protein
MAVGESRGVPHMTSVGMMGEAPIWGRGVIVE